MITLTRIMTVTTELLTISFLKEEGFKSNLKHRVGVSLPYLGRGLVPAGVPDRSVLGHPF